MASQRNLLAGLIFVFAFFTANSCFSADLKIGIMNVQKIIIECDAGKAAKGRFDTKMKQLQSSFKGEEEALKALQAEIKKKSSAWSEEKKAEKVREFQKNGRELQAKTEDARFEMKKLQDKELEPILKALEEVVNKFGKDNGYTAIMDGKNGVVYFDPSVDVSDIIVKKLNAALAKK
ncbi:OmpH family outer membrane protein [Desulfopila sp. IMCC35006]|uniref:OmpH family outer membrane protein n=1 Tax=Desulfopila sp. IMCC35006 TaxID=2569542 RepID=UPI0010AD2663|nr:OmpH family outer membrane protein [Desulfopila sp. IMCC35006]TKB24135.1 OmpH family outer membrane protein [Desulfopila sp. IMCC35006]